MVIRSWVQASPSSANVRPGPRPVAATASRTRMKAPVLASGTSSSVPSRRNANRISSRSFRPTETSCRWPSTWICSRSRV